MLVQINNHVGQYGEWCIIEFQGEIVGDYEGAELGKLEIKQVRSVLIFKP